MNDRHWIGDVGLAVLIAVPTLALSRPQPTVPQPLSAQSPAAQQIAMAERTPARQLNLEG